MVLFLERSNYPYKTILYTICKQRFPYASKVCASGIAALGFALSGCHSGPEPSATPQHHSVRLDGRAFDVFVSSPGVGAKRPCSWYGARNEDLLYFGEAAFWNALRETGEPTADLKSSGPQRIGRFQLYPEPRMLAPVQVATDRPSGVWDVFPHANGRLYFTTFFESAGYVDLKDNRVKRFPETGYRFKRMGGRASRLALRDPVRSPLRRRRGEPSLDGPRGQFPRRNPTACLFERDPDRPQDRGLGSPETRKSGSRPMSFPNEPDPKPTPHWS